MIPGYTPSATYAIAELPAAIVQATESPLATLLRNPRVKKTYLLEASPYDPAKEEPVDVRISTDGYRTKRSDPTLPDVLFAARLESALNVDVRILDESGRLRTFSLPTFGELIILNPRGELDEYAGYEWTQRDLAVKVGSEAFAYADFGPIFGGTCEGISWTLEHYRLQLRDRGYALQRPLQSSKYGGFGACIRHDGVDDYTRSGTIGTRQTTTLETIFRCYGSTGAAQHVAQLFDTWDASGVDFYAVIDDTAGNISLITHRGSGSTASTASSGYDYRDGKRHHLALVISDDGTTRTAKLYVDGIQKGSTFTPPAYTARANAKLDVGGVGGVGGYGKLEIDEVRLWSTARTPEQLLANKDREISVSEAGLVHYWKLNEATGTTAFDSVASGAVNMTLNGGGAWIGSLEGEASIAGRYKPRTFGQVRQFDPIPVDSVNLIYQLNDGPIQAVDVVKVAGGPTGLTAAGDVADLYATTVTAGQFKTDLSKGLIRLGAKPVAPSGSGAGVLTCDFRGDSAGGYVATAGGIGKKLVRLALPDAQIDLSAFDALALLAPQVLHCVAGLDEVSLDTKLVDVLASVGAYVTQTHSGLVTAARLDAPDSPVGVITENEALINDIERVAIAPPAKSITLGYRRYHRTISGGDLATSLSSEERSDLSTELRHVTSVNTDTTLLTRHLDAEEISADTLLDVQTDAQAEGDRRVGLYGVRRELYRVPLANGLFQYEVGATLLFKIQRFALHAGRAMRVVGYTYDVASDSTSIWLWG